MQPEPSLHGDGMAMQPAAILRTAHPPAMHIYQPGPALPQDMDLRLSAISFPTRMPSYLAHTDLSGSARSRDCSDIGL